MDDMLAISYWCTFVCIHVFLVLYTMFYEHRYTEKPATDPLSWRSLPPISLNCVACVLHKKLFT